MYTVIDFQENKIEATDKILESNIELKLRNSSFIKTAFYEFNVIPLS